MTQPKFGTVPAAKARTSAVTSKLRTPPARARSNAVAVGVEAHGLLFPLDGVPMSQSWPDRRR